MVTHYRIDCRLVHGQTMTVLRKEYPCDGIIVVDDELVKDELMCQFYKTAAGGNVKVYIYTVEKAMVQLPKAVDSQKNYYVIFRNALTVQELLKGGVEIGKTITVGPQSARPDTTDYIFGISLTQNEEAAMDYIEAQGHALEFNPFNNRTVSTWSEVKAKKQ